MPKILIIEDENSVRANLAELLEAEDYAVITAGNGAEGLRLARQHAPDLIMCDVMMPELDGHGVLAALRQDPATALTPFIFLTALSDRGAVRRGMNLGADDYVTKPFTRADVLDAVTSRLARHGAFIQRQAVEVKQAEAQLLYVDRLTGLPNRLSLREHFARTVAEATQPQHVVPVLCLDLDRFKRIMSGLGQAAGDDLLQEVAGRLKASVNGRSTVARLEGNQFIVILSPREPESVPGQAAAAILAAVAQPMRLQAQEVFLTASLGQAVYPRDGAEIDQLIRNAETAMWHSKQLGGNTYQVYHNEMNARSALELTLETDLHYALERSEFRVHYQPQVSLETGQLAGAEALVRWQHPTRGLVSPGDFIPLAEETGLIVPLGEWVLTTVCRQIQAWQAAGLRVPRVAVNLSGRQFRQPDLAERLVQNLASTGLASDQLELELTESLVMHDLRAVQASLQVLQAQGLKISIDDFGTGYSSLSYLQQLPLNTLKIDQSFVRGLVPGSERAAIVIAIIQMARGLRLNIIAEGVETEAELAFLRAQGCREGQGYLFSRPVPAEEFAALLAAGARWPPAREAGGQP